MSTTPVTLPKFWPQLEGKAEPEVGTAVKLLYTGIQQHDQAITALKQQLDAAVLAKTTVTTTTAATTTTSSNAFPGLGLVNDQRGSTSYMTQQSDNGALILLADASPIAVTLNSGVTKPFLAYLSNYGTGTTTLTPSVGLVNGGATYSLLANLTALMVFDGTNWFVGAVPVIPITLAVVTHKFLTSYDAATGLFTAAQPAFTDISGVAATAQIPNLPESQITGLTADLAAKAPIASPTFTGTVTEPDAPVLTAATTTTSATAGAATALPATPAGYLTISINGTLQKIPYFGV